eukprot:g69523.t1
MLGLDPQALPKVVDTRATISYKAYHAGLACMLQSAFFSKKARGMAESIEGLFVFWLTLTLRMHSKVVKANPRYFFTIERPIFDDRVHVALITMFEEIEATQATGMC